MKLSDKLTKEAEGALLAGATAHEMGLDPASLGNWYEGGASAFRHAAELARAFEVKLTQSLPLDSIAVESVETCDGLRVQLAMHSAHLGGGFQMSLSPEKAKELAAAILQAAGTTGVVS